MKKLLFSAVLTLAVFCWCSLGASAQAQSGGQGQGLIGQAIGAFHSNCGPAQLPLQGFVNEPIGGCEGNETIRVYLVWKPNCNQVPCELILLGPVGYVDFDCDGNVLSVTCYN